MGASNLYVCQAAETMGKAYDLAVEYALDEEGHNSYNGTISTTSGCVDKTSLFTGDAEAWEELALDATDKWGHVWGRKVEGPSSNYHYKDREGFHDYVFVGWAAE